MSADDWPPRRRWLRAAAAPLLAGLSCRLARGETASGAPAFAFAVVGDVPYGALEERLHEQVLQNLDADCAFVIHVGDLKGGGESCADDLLARRHRLLTAVSALPLVYVPGDNDWVDCIRPSNGGFDPIERLRHLRRLFFDRSPSWVGAPFAVQRQSDVEADSDAHENLRWRWGGTTFVTLNRPGDVEWDRLDDRQRDAVRQVLDHGERWLRRAFAETRDDTLVVIAHADPHFGRDRRLATDALRRDPHRAFRGLLRDIAGGFAGQVLFVHGDTHLFRNDQPLLDARGRPLRNFTRVESFGSPFASAWVHVRVTPGSATPFFVNTRQLPAAAPTPS